MKERTKPMSTTGAVHIFSGKVFCLECERYMRKKNTKKHEYLVCSNNRDGYDDCENKASIRYDELANIVDEFIDKIYIGKLNEETKSRDIQIKWNFE